MKPLQPKIGLLCSIGDWYRIYCGTDFIPIVKNDYEKTKRILARMGDFVVIDPGIVETVEQAQAAGELFRQNNVDIIISVQLTWTSEECIMKVCDQVPQTPLVLFMTQGVKGIPEDLDLNTYRRNWGINGNVQLTSSLRRMRPQSNFGHMVGHIEEESAQNELNAWIQAAALLKDMKGRKSYYLPSNCPKFYGIWANDAELVRLFGLDIQFLPDKVMVDAYNSMDEEAVHKETEAFYELYEVVEPRREWIEIELRNYLAFKKVCQTHDLSMLTVQPWPYLVRQTGSFGLVALSLLVDRDGYAGNDEGDMNCTISGWILNRISNKPVQMFENLGFDLEKNLIFGGHDGFCPPSLAEGKPKVRSSMSGDLKEGTNMGFEFIVKPGPVTILGVGFGTDGYFLRATKGIALESPARSIHMPHTLIHLERSSVRQYFDNLHDMGGGHHYSLVHGNYTMEIEKIGKLLNIPVVQL